MNEKYFTDLLESGVFSKTANKQTKDDAEIVIGGGAGASSQSDNHHASPLRTPPLTSWLF